MTRTRVRVTRDVYGSVKGGAWNINQHQQDKSVCNDELHPYPYRVDGPLYVNHVDRGGITLCQGQRVDAGDNLIICRDMMPDVLDGSDFNFVPDPSVPTVGSDALRVLALTNPSRGEAEVGEDLSSPLGKPIRKIRDIGDSLITNAADAHLWTVFGFLPFIEDLKKILKHQELEARRLREIDSLFKNGGLRRKVQLGSYSVQNVGSGPIHSNGFAVSAVYKRNTTRKRWGTVRWSPLGNAWLSLSDIERTAKVRRMIYGLDFDEPTTLWRLMPWTWLINWFTEVGNLQKAFKQGIPVLPGNVCIMTQTTHTVDVRVTAISNWVSGGGGTIRRTEKVRNIVPSGGLPRAFFKPNVKLGPERSSILGSLFVQRFLR